MPDSGHACPPPSIRAPCPVATSDSRAHRAADKTQAAAKLDFRISNNFDKLRHLFAFIRTLDIYM